MQGWGAGALLGGAPNVGMPPAGGILYANANPDPPPAQPPPASRAAPCRVLLVQVHPQGELPEKFRNIHRGTLARAAFYRRVLKCEVQIIRVLSAMELACIMWKLGKGEKAEVREVSSRGPPSSNGQTNPSSIAGKFLHIEVDAHGSPAGADQEFSALDADAFGLAAGTALTSGLGAQGHIILNWCESCSLTSKDGIRPGGRIAGMSGHVVYGLNTIGSTKDISRSGGVRPQSSMGNLDFDEGFPLPPTWDPQGSEDYKRGSHPGSGWVVSYPMREKSFDVQAGVEPGKETFSIRNDGEEPAEILVRASEAGSFNLPFSPWEVGAPVEPEKVTSKDGQGFSLRDTQNFDPHLNPRKEDLEQALGLTTINRQKVDTMAPPKYGASDMKAIIAKAPKPPKQPADLPARATPAQRKAHEEMMAKYDKANRAFARAQQEHEALLSAATRAQAASKSLEEKCKK